MKRLSKSIGVAIVALIGIVAQITSGSVVRAAAASTPATTQSSQSVAELEASRTSLNSFFRNAYPELADDHQKTLYTQQLLRAKLADPANRERPLKDLIVEAADQAMKEFGIPDDASARIRCAQRELVAVPNPVTKETLCMSRKDAALFKQAAPEPSQSRPISSDTRLLTLVPPSSTSTTAAAPIAPSLSSHNDESSASVSWSPIALIEFSFGAAFVPCVFWYALIYLVGRKSMHWSFSLLTGVIAFSTYLILMTLLNVIGFSQVSLGAETPSIAFAHWVIPFFLCIAILWATGKTIKWKDKA